MKGFCRVENARRKEGGKGRRKKEKREGEIQDEMKKHKRIEKRRTRRNKME